MLTTKIEENPWNIQSIYELQYFNCPTCVFKNQSKQTFINHAYEYHPDAIGESYFVRKRTLEIYQSQSTMI